MNNSGNPKLFLWILFAILLSGIPIAIFHDGDTLNAGTNIVLLGIVILGLRDMLGARSVFFLMLMIFGIDSFIFEDYILSSIFFGAAAWEWRNIIKKEPVEEGE